ncbi:unnamed protein product [Prunus armeniaca]|uniref:Uncharacterized protein n=1 Tax=Prunus armeniaca TaxID=36596 RepID=A0A6J5VL92_PRUAR|nr:unnamed protein product [Prunus armeniaca]
MAKENESASQATVNGDNTLTRSTMSSIGEEDAFCLGKHMENVRDIDGAVRGFLILGVMIDLC